MPKLDMSKVNLLELNNDEIEEGWEVQTSKR